MPHHTLTVHGTAGMAIVVVGIGVMAVKGTAITLTLPQHFSKCCGKTSATNDLPVTLEMVETVQTPLPSVVTPAPNSGADEAEPDTAATPTAGAPMTERQTLVAIGFALMVGVCTSIYSIDDALGVTVVDPL
jgi:hypothetical protein